MTEGRVYLYGIGNAGSLTNALLRKNGIRVEGFFDRCGGEELLFDRKRVFRSDESTLSACGGRGAVMIVAFLCTEEKFESLRCRLKGLGWESVYYFQTIRYFFDLCGILVPDGREQPACPAEEALARSAAWLADDESMEILEDFLKAVINGAPELYARPSEQEQYFVRDIPFARGYSRFVDCGAFDGDTAMALLRNQGRAEAMVLFEPDGENFKKLRRRLKETRAAEEQVLFPCGVWEECGLLRFRSGAASSSGLTEEGDQVVPCVAIDDVIGDFHPTFLKMDIEGAEYRALKGASGVIAQDKPDLAISVYHTIEHMWEVPTLLKRLVPEYRFYLRSHAPCGMETILYAVTEGA